MICCRHQVMGWQLGAAGTACSTRDTFLALQGEPVNTELANTAADVVSAAGDPGPRLTAPVTQEEGDVVG